VTLLLLLLIFCAECIGLVTQRSHAIMAVYVYRVGQQGKPAYFCSNLVYCQPIGLFEMKIGWQ